MAKKVLIIAVLSLMLFQSTAFAFVETKGDVVFRSALYGAALGAIFGGAIYLVDQDYLAAKIGTGVAIGMLGGLFFGITETRSIVEIKKDNIKFALPMPVIQKKGNGIMYSTSLVKFDF